MPAPDNDGQRETGLVHMILQACPCGAARWLLARNLKLPVLVPANLTAAFPTQHHTLTVCCLSGHMV